jgi:transcriptional regulator of aromatic amino acid metabolism
MNTIIQDKCHELHKGKRISTSTLPALEYTIVNGKIKVDLQWYKQNITSIKIPQLKDATKYWENVKVNKHVAEQFINVFDEIEKEGLVKYIISYGGSYNPRYIRGSTTKLSNHSLGLAIDVNMLQNKLNTIGAEPGTYGSLHEVAPIFNKHGFLWGATFSRKDYMHFEAKYII